MAPQNMTDYRNLICTSPLVLQTLEAGFPAEMENLQEF